MTLAQGLILLMLISRRVYEGSPDFYGCVVDLNSEYFIGRCIEHTFIEHVPQLSQKLIV